LHENLYNPAPSKSTEVQYARMSKPKEPTPTVANLKAPPIYKVIVTQFVVTVIAALCSLALTDLVAAYSVFLGGMISTGPNAYFALKVFRYRGARQMPMIVKSFYAGETGKLIITAALFAVVFAGIKPLNELAVIVSFVVTLVAGLIATVKMGLKST
jgi:ATP synthase protein I